MTQICSAEVDQAEIALCVCDRSPESMGDGAPADAEAVFLGTSMFATAGRPPQKREAPDRGARVRGLGLVDVRDGGLKVSR